VRLTAVAQGWPTLRSVVITARRR